MPQLFDIAQVDAEVSAFLETEKPKMELPGYEGAVARLQQEILKVVTIWRAKEFNRGTDSNTVLNCIVGMCTSSIMGEVTSVIGPNGSIDAKLAVANNCLQALGEELACIIMQGEKAIRCCEAIEAGNA